MSQPVHPNRHLFVSLPVSDLDRSVEFFTKLGFTFNPLFSDETGSCMLVGEQAFIMLITRERYLEFSKGKPFADLEKTVSLMLTFSLDSREEVDRIVELAIANGGRPHDEPEDHGFMYSRDFRDPDGHYFSAMWMDPAAAEDGPEVHKETANA